MIRTALLIVAGLCFASAAKAEMNTVELDAAMDKCRRHTVSSGGQWVFAPSWEECNTIEQIWDAKQGGGHVPAEQEKIDVHNAMMKALGQ